MTNDLCIFMYLPLLIINVMLMLSAVLRKQKLYVDRLYIILCGALIGWLVFELLFYIIKDPQGIEFVFTAKFMFIAYIPVLFFFLVAGFYHLNEKMPRALKIAFFVFPTLLAIVVATTLTHHELFRVGFAVLSTEPLTEITSTWGPWYIANLIASQVPVVLILVIFITQYRKLPRVYRTSVNLLLIGFVIYLNGFIMEVFGLEGRSTLDVNLISICVSNFIFYIAVSSNGRADYLNIWRRDIFDYVDEAVLILNDEGMVVEANQPAMRMLEGVVPVVKGISIDALLHEAQAGGKVFLRDVIGKDGLPMGKDLYITKGKYPIIYSMRRIPLPGGAQEESGEFVSFADMTQNRLLIERMQETVGVDALTGLKNRFGYERMLRAVDRPANLPLSIIFGDVNGLKSVNDTYGHEAGDLLLVKVAEVLEVCFPEGHIARVGGDEFVILLTRCTQEAAGEAIGRVQSAIEGIEGFAYPISIALGSATKTRAAQNINQLIARADKSMYLHKEALEEGADE